MKAYGKKYITTGSNMTSTYFCNCIAPKIRISILRLVVVPIPQHVSIYFSTRCIPMRCYGLYKNLRVRASTKGLLNRSTR